MNACRVEIVMPDRTLIWPCATWNQGLRLFTLMARMTGPGDVYLYSVSSAS